MTNTDVQTASVSDIAKAMLADPLKRIELDAFINGPVRTSMAVLSLEHFPPRETSPRKNLPSGSRLNEAATSDLTTIVILLARWS